MRYAALLRGVNLGNRRMGMADLRRVLESLGMTEVSTYLQSGNAVFATERGDTDRLKEGTEQAIAEEFGFEVLVVLVTARQLAAVIACCPYRAQADADPTKVHVTFLEPMPPGEEWSKIDPAAVTPEEMAVGPGVVYMHLPSGMGRAVLPDLVAKRTARVTATTRNWRTVMALAELLSAG